jgi:hypothetical protein
MTYSTPELIDLSVDRFLIGEITLVQMLWFWLWLWLGICRSEYIDAFAESEYVCAFSEAECNVAASMHSGPWNASDWLEWVVALPHIGYAIRANSNY